MKPINWKTDPKTWAAHSGWTVGFILIAHFIFMNAPYIFLKAGWALGLGIFYMKEWAENRGQYWPWKWAKLDSIIDFLSPVVIGFFLVGSLV